MAKSSDIKTGSVLRYNNELCSVTEVQHRTPGNLRAFYQVRMKNIRSGKSLEHRFRADETVEIARVEYNNYQFIYPEGEHIVVMHPETFEQIHLPISLLADKVKFLKEGMDIKVGFENDEPLVAEAPTFVELEVAYTEPGVKGDTATNTLKVGKLETGAEINIPLFVNQGEKIRIDTRTESYVERVK